MKKADLPEFLGDRKPPTTPEQEGLYALIDASGEALARCSLADFPENAELPTDHVVVDDQVYFGIEPTNRIDHPDGSFTFEGHNTMHLAAEGGYSLAVSVALPGAGPGPCRVTPMSLGEDFQLKNTEGIAASFKQQATARLDDAEDAMLPAQVALDTPGLSDGARAWLEDRLDDTVDDAEETEQATDLPEQIEAWVDELNR